MTLFDTTTPVADPLGDGQTGPAGADNCIANGVHASGEDACGSNTHPAGSVLEFFVHGVPSQQGSKRGYVVNGRAVIVEDSKRTRPWREAVKHAALDVIIDTGWPLIANGGVELDVTFWLPRPKSHYRTGRNAHLLRDDAPARPTTKPDGDKMLRLVCDSLTDAGAYRDDAQITDYAVHKRYVDHGHIPGAQVRLRPEGLAP